MKRRRRRPTSSDPPNLPWSPPGSDRGPRLSRGGVHQEEVAVCRGERERERGGAQGVKVEDDMACGRT